MSLVHDGRAQGLGNVFVGGWHDAEDLQKLANADVAVVVSVLYPDQMEGMRIPPSIRPHFFDCTRFGDVNEWVRLVDVVWDVLASGKSVFVHCAAGIHRAPVVASGILSAWLEISFSEAYELVASARYVEP